MIYDPTRFRGTGNAQDRGYFVGMAYNTFDSNPYSNHVIILPKSAQNQHQTVSQALQTDSSRVSWRCQ